MATVGRKTLDRFLFGVLLIVLMAPSVLFFFWMVSISLKTNVENLAYPPVIIPTELTLANYATVFQNSPFGQYALNSLIVGVGSTGLALLLGVPAGYGIARSRQYGAALFILVARMTPALSYLIPWFLLFRQIGLSNTYQALILTHLIIGLPLVIWIMLGFFEDVHPELEDAARIDGCTRFGGFLRVAVPLTLPGIVVSGILAFIFSWNNFIFAVVLAGPRLQTLPVAVFNVMTFEQINWGPLAAAALLVTSPVLMLTLVVQRHIVAGLAAGGLKG
ncbi:MAG TPA: carbohydrate ABC transporter permease [Chloroflexota bacterium]